MNEIAVTDYNQNLKPVNGTVAIYARVALDENNDLKKQADMLIKNVEAVGESCYSVYYECESGRNHQRKEFLRLMTDIKNNKYKRLYIKDISRLTRDFTKMNEIIEKIRSAGVEIIVMQ